ncbi:putative RNA-directed DNA polymerase, eukaryota, reverse transcriptase zinc-binding domain protein [Tanacetum coccineum]
MPKSAWTEKDQIDNFLKERRLMRSLEKFVGGRLYEGGLRYKVVRHRYSNIMIQPELEGSTQGYLLDSVEVLSDKVLKLKNFKKDATLKLFKSTNQEKYEHVGPEVTSSQDGKVYKTVKRDYAWLMISRAQRITKLYEFDNLEKLESLDLIQKARIKWDVEGDENSKYFHDKFDSHDNLMNLPPFTAERSLSISDCNYLEPHFWDYIKHDIQSFMVKFFESNMLPQGTNSRFITLIPKIPNPLFIKDYRPISLIGIQYKIIAKILANRLSKVIDSLVSLEQSAFISGQKILDGPLILSEIIDWYNKRKRRCYSKWILKRLLIRTSILINGSPTLEFSLKRGLRQGDPLSSFLFIFIVEGLHISLRDTMDQRDMENIIHVLHVFYMASGLKININKSNLFRVGVSSEEVVNMAATSGCLSSSLPLSYLGLPIGSNMNRVASWKVLIDRFKNKLPGWKASFLSIGGRLTLIKSVLGSLGIYYMSIFKAPEIVLKAKIVGTINHLHSSDLVPFSSIKYKVGDGSLIRFWIDTWAGDSPLCDRFNRLFHLENSKECSIQDHISNGSWSWDWIRPISSGRSLTDYIRMLNVIGSIEVGQDSNSCSWSLTNDGNFTVGSLRHHIDECLLPSLTSST